MSGEDALYDVALHVCKPEVAALVLERQPGMVNSKAIENSRVQIMDVDGIAHDVVTVIIGFSICDPRFDATPGHPDREATWVVVAPVILGGQFALAVNGSAEFAAPDDQSVIQ